MGNKKLPVYFILAVFLAVSCGTTPDLEPKPEQAQADAPPVESVGPVNTTQDTGFNLLNVSREYYDTTKEDVQHFIEDLNLIISRRNYNAWRAALSDEYFREISSQGNLQEWSNSVAMRARNIVLRTAEDYFLNVVVPSRANSRVDEIEFISENRVKAFTINTNNAGEETWLRLYDLEKIGNTWKIIN